MTRSKAALTEALIAYVRANPTNSLEQVSHVVVQELRKLAESGRLKLGADKDLAGESLEVRVFLLFQSMGLDIRRGRPSLEDFVVEPPAEAKTKHPLVIEVKSGRKSSVSRDDLRQLDDWVFELSQEEIARKQGLGGGFDPLAMETQGLVSLKHHHPTPHKGVLVFNVPVGTPFDQRTSDCLSPDELTFARKRNFCVIPIKHLIDTSEIIAKGEKSATDFWESIHESLGEYGKD